MGIKLQSRDNNHIIHVTDMKDGDIAEIINWSYSSVIGVIVQRYKDVIIRIGVHSQHSWPSLFIPRTSPDSGVPECCKVRLLEEGEILEITKGK
jgi:hypothetical protein